MDLVKTAKHKLSSIDEGEHTVGLSAVVDHIDLALKHFARGQDTSDARTYSDVIYRCNQAFEGSLKEGFRVIGGKSPDRLTPYKIEQYLIEKSILRARVLAQLKNYRIEWRNPSTHNHALDFDADEALLAIVNVWALTIVLMDQIIERLSYEKLLKPQPEDYGNKVKNTVTEEDDVALFIATLIQYYFQRANSHGIDIGSNQYEVIGTIWGLVIRYAKDVTVSFDMQKNVSDADMMIKYGDKRIYIDVKKTTHPESQIMKGLLSFKSIRTTDKSAEYIVVCPTPESRIVVSILKTDVASRLFAVVGKSIAERMQADIKDR